MNWLVRNPLKKTKGKRYTSVGDQQVSRSGLARTWFMRQHNIFGKDGWAPGRTSGHRRPKKRCEDIVRGIVTGRDNVKGKEILHRASPEKLQKKEKRKIVKRLCRGQLLQTSSNLPPLLLDSVLTQFPILVFLWTWHFYRRKLYQRTGQQENIMSVYGRHFASKSYNILNSIVSMI